MACAAGRKFVATATRTSPAAIAGADKRPAQKTSTRQHNVVQTFLDALFRGRGSPCESSRGRVDLPGRDAGRPCFEGGSPVFFSSLIIRHAI